MTGRARDYVKQVREQSNFWLNWTPASPLSLGDIVERESGVWRRIGSVTDRGVVVKAAVDGSAAGAPWVSQSASGVTLETSAQVDPPEFKFVKPGELGVKVSFQGANKYLLSLQGARFHSIASIDAFWDDVRREYSIWHWDLGRRIVTSVCVADSGTFLGSGSSGSSFELAADVGVNVGTVDLGKISANFKLVSTFSGSETFASLNNITPLFRTHKVTLLGNIGAAAAQDPDSPLMENTELTEDDSTTDDAD